MINNTYCINPELFYQNERQGYGQKYGATSFEAADIERKDNTLSDMKLAAMSKFAQIKHEKYGTGLKNIGFKDGVAYGKKDSAPYTGKLRARLKNGNTVIITYENGEPVKSFKKGKDGFEKTITKGHTEIEDLDFIKGYVFSKKTGKLFTGTVLTEKEGAETVSYYNHGKLKCKKYNDGKIETFNNEKARFLKPSKISEKDPATLEKEYQKYRTIVDLSEYHLYAEGESTDPLVVDIDRSVSKALKELRPAITMSLREAFILPYLQFYGKEEAENLYDALNEFTPAELEKLTEHATDSHNLDRAIRCGKNSPEFKEHIQACKDCIYRPKTVRTKTHRAIPKREVKSA